MATLHRERVEHALNELLVRIVPEDPNENEDEANQRFEDAYEFALDELTTAGDASLVPDVQHIASLIDRKVSGPNNDQRKSARLHNLLSRLETQSVLDQKWRMLYFLYNLSDNAEAPHEPPPAQDARSFSREPTTPSKRQSVAASSHAIQDAFAKPGLTQLPVNAGSPKAPTSTRPASIAEKPEKRRRPDTAKEQQQANGGHVEKAETGPLEPKTIEYCQNDIIHLPALREIYIARIKPEWLNKAKEESEHRATQARSPEYDPQSEGKKLGPWGSGGKERILTIDQMCEMMEEEREEAIARDLFGFDDDLEFLDGDDVWDQEGPGDYEDWGALHSDWDKY